MKSRISVGWALMAVALALSFVPAATIGVQQARAQSGCDWAQFIADVSIPDGTTLAPSTAFTKTWRLKNIGSCTWTTGYSLVFDSGDSMGGPTSVSFPTTVYPGQTVDISVGLTAPAAAGQHIGYWKFRNASGFLFGIGSNMNTSWWVEINVSGTGGGGTAYDFAANYCSASWSSMAGSLPCPGTDGDPRGFVLRVTNPQLESGTTDTGSGLITMPQNAYNGDIHGVFPAFHVQPGDRFQSVINCAYGATSCYVTFRLDYQIGSGPIYTFWSFREKYEGLYFRTNVNLSPLAGQDVKFILTVLATGSAMGDRALWSNPMIVRGGGGPFPYPPPPPGHTPYPPPSGCDRAQFVSDVTVPDGTLFSPGASFTKTWRLKNVGSCTWTTSYLLVFDSGDQMGGPATANLPHSVYPGQTVDLTLTLTAPNAGGHYRGFWKFQNSSGVRFGIGAAGTSPWFVDILVSGPTATPTNTPTGTLTSTPTSTATGLFSSARDFDFGTATSPLAFGWARVTKDTAFTAGAYGWTNTSSLLDLDRGAPNNRWEDFVYSSANRTFKVALPNGTYTVTVTMGDNNAARDQMVVKVGGVTKLGPVDTAAGAWDYNHPFSVTVTGGFLALDFSDAGGTDPEWVVNEVNIDLTSPPPTNTPTNTPTSTPTGTLTNTPTSTPTSTATSAFASARDFDFGTATSPLAYGWARVTKDTVFTAGAYGWTSTSSLLDLDRGAPNNRWRDFVYSSANKTFQVALPDGIYTVTVTMGDYTTARDQMVVKVGGVTKLGPVDTAAGSFDYNHPFTVTVSGGILALDFSDAGGTDPDWVVNEVNISP
jgi:hypothetical protein